MKIHWFLWVARHRTVFRGHPKEHETKSTGVPKVVRETYCKVKRERRRNIHKIFDFLLQNGTQNGARRSLFDLLQRLGQVSRTKARAAFGLVRLENGEHVILVLLEGLDAQRRLHAHHLLPPLHDAVRDDESQAGVWSMTA